MVLHRNLFDNQALWRGRTILPPATNRCVPPRRRPGSPPAERTVSGSLRPLAVSSGHPASGGTALTQRAFRAPTPPRALVLGQALLWAQSLERTAAGAPGPTRPRR